VTITTSTSGGETHQGGPHPHDRGRHTGPGSKLRARRVAGFVLITVGLTLLGVVVWEFWGTNWVAHRAQERIVQAVKQEWEQGDGVHGGNGAVEVAEGRTKALVHIPRFGDDYVIPVLEGTGEDVLAVGYGHFDGTAEPGGIGNYALAAHRVTHGEPLRRMPELQPGDQVVIETQSKIFTYVLDTGGDDLVVDFGQGWVTASVPHNPDPGGVEPKQQPGQRLITLVTCAEIFHTENRMVAFGHLKTVSWKH